MTDIAQYVKYYSYSEGVGEAVLLFMQQLNGNAKCHPMMAAFSQSKLFITSLCLQRRNCDNSYSFSYEVLFSSLFD